MRNNTSSKIKRNKISNAKQSNTLAPKNTLSGSSFVATKLYIQAK
ncbi:protein of unknown function [Streptococcus thermophilus]|uniref:Uncharacterized protein n=1 Tax=Streptococcus thermophilus TaxID=1308 RepID=A0AAU9H7U6_STRTR|nr:protein of unknown function [Streptococcus thermophilus]CAD0134949.1 protein of unknown function [Streptococcus thermophilus]CAD0154685.1 protein of unknown function [Streptococcus thermophilus]CAD0156649.1 protein of unknown function [Streptococcus thermophilus]CAD0182552.1 protein of unknown function [Streptococcus thermophilus]